MSAELIEYLSRLIISEGQGAGERMVLLPWQKRFVRGAFQQDVISAALSIARGNGKSTLVAGIACATLDGPLHEPRAQTIVCASSLNQGKVILDHVVEFMAAKYPRIRERHHRDRWRLRDSSGIASIEDRRTGASVRVIGSDPRRAHGLAPKLVLADEPAQWPPGLAEGMRAALLTSMGKIQGSRMFALGTRPDSDRHWFQRELDGGADYAQSHHAGDKDPPFRKATWAKANPSLPHMPNLARAIQSEARKAKRDPAMLAAFKALRLNQGVSDVVRASLLGPEVWVEAEADVPREGRCIWGIDLGATAAMSAVAAVWESGRLECLGAFPSDPDLEARERTDGAVGLYSAMHRAGDLVLAPGRTVPVQWLIKQAMERFGEPDVVVADRWRAGELQDAVDVLCPWAPIQPRGQGFRDGADDLRRFRTAVLDGTLRPVRQLLLRSAMSEAVTVADPAGNEKLAKSTEGGRRHRARDDAAAAAILAAAELHRWVEDPTAGDTGPAFQHVLL